MSPRQTFDKALYDLKQDILRMAGLVEQAIYESVESLMKQDVTLAAQAIMGDETIDELYLEVEAKIIKLIATQQPMAKDLRIVVTGIKILLSLERMADHAVDIARATMCLSARPFKVDVVEYIPQMAKLARQMLKDGLDAYVNDDIEKAQKMCAGDDEVDYIFAKVFRELMCCMRKDPDTVTECSYLLYVSRYLERVADHATNIGEAVVYLVTGERKELN